MIKIEKFIMSKKKNQPECLFNSIETRITITVNMHGIIAHFIGYKL